MKKLTKTQQHALGMVLANMCGFTGGALGTHILYKHGLLGSKENKVLLISGMADVDDDDDEECDCGRCEECGGW